VPTIETIVETGIYADDLSAAERFYADILGLEVRSRQEGRHVFFRVPPSSMLLIFRSQESSQPGDIPSHGASGPGHFAFGIPTAELEVWRTHLLSHGVAIEREVEWSLGGRSIYFRDPAGNSVELLTRGLWDLPDGW